MAIDARKHAGRVAVSIDLAIGDGRTGPAEIVVTPLGLEVRRRGTRRRLWSPWSILLDRMPAPSHAPAKYLSWPTGYLFDDSPAVPVGERSRHGCA